MAEPTLFDEASLALIASGGAGKDGKVYSIKPVPEYGPEKVTNGDFATDSNWNKGSGTTISGGKANFSNASSVSLYQNIGTPGSVRATFSVTDYTSGSLKIYAGGYPIGTSLIEATAVGDYSVEINTTGGNGNIIFGSSDNFTGSIDNVSIKQIISGDFTFSRGSNLSATRVGPDGLIEKGRENLLTYSNDFSNTTWAKSSVSVASGQSGYDGSSNAWLLDITGGTSSQRLEKSVSQSGVQTASIYAKAGTRDWIRFRLNTSGTTAQSYFDLANGALGASYSGLIDRKIEDVGGGWYRCSISFNSTSNLIRIYPAEANGDVTHTSGNILIQNAQLEIGLAATEVIESGASTGKAGLLEDEPRFDYSGGATCPSLLLEPSRTNLAIYSEYIQGLSLTGLTATPNATSSPEGVQNAYKVLTGTGNNDQIFEQATGTSGNTKTQSVYIKADSGVQWIRLIQIRSGFANSASTWFDIQNGVKGSKTEGGTTSVVDDATKIEDAGNGWYRLTLVCTDSTNNTIFDTRVRTAAGNSSTSRVSNGSYFVWGYQMESNASYPTSYIPNHSGGTITRGADAQSQLTIPNGSATEGTIFYEFDKAQAPNSFDITPLKVGSVKVLSVQQYNPNMRFDINNNAANYTKPNSYNSHIKVAVSYVGSVVKLFINGNLRATDNTYSGSGSVIVPTYGLQTTQIGCSIESKQLLYFPEALSDTECIKLTTI